MPIFHITRTQPTGAKLNFNHSTLLAKQHNSNIVGTVATMAAQVETAANATGHNEHKKKQNLQWTQPHWYFMKANLRVEMCLESSTWLVCVTVRICVFDFHAKLTRLKSNKKEIRVSLDTRTKWRQYTKIDRKTFYLFRGVYITNSYGNFTFHMWTRHWSITLTRYRTQRR